MVAVVVTTVLANDTEVIDWLKPRGGGGGVGVARACCCCWICCCCAERWLKPGGYEGVPERSDESMPGGYVGAAGLSSDTRASTVDTTSSIPGSSSPKRETVSYQQDDIDNEREPT